MAHPVLWIYVVQSFKLFLGISDCNFFLFYVQLFTAILLSMAQNVCVIYETCNKAKSVLSPWYSSIVFDLYNKELSGGLFAS